MANPKDHTPILSLVRPPALSEMSPREEEGDALWALVEYERGLLTRPGLSDDFRHRLARRADFDAMRAQLRLPLPAKPRALAPRQAG